PSHLLVHLSMDFLSLPEHAFGVVCSFCNDKSLMTLREVSKPVKDKVDKLILNIKRTTVSHLEIEECMHSVIDHGISTYQQRGERASINFRIGTRRNFHLWKIGLNYVLSKLNMERIKQNAWEIELNIELGNVRIFLDHVKSHSKGAEYNSLALSELPEILQPCLDFFDNLKKIYMRRWRGEMAMPSIYPMFIDFIKKVQPNEVLCQVELQKNDSAPFVLELADLVKTINISLGEGDDVFPLPDVFPLICDMLSRKCDTLDLCDYNQPIASIKATDAERLIQYFHHLGKRINFNASIDMELLRTVIGNYEVKVDDNRDNPTNYLKIRHLDI
ncbi:hypothetical protein PMAYCL1PPCAC_11424, partial [Pristionchus mayeri]